MTMRMLINKLYTVDFDQLQMKRCVPGIGPAVAAEHPHGRLGEPGSWGFRLKTLNPKPCDLGFWGVGTGFGFRV